MMSAVNTLSISHPSVGLFCKQEPVLAALFLWSKLAHGKGMMGKYITACIVVLIYDIFLMRWTRGSHSTSASIQMMLYH